MTLSLNTIKASRGKTKTRKRVGRGNASGSGTYSGRGMKGQKARSGVSKMKLKRIGIKRGRSALRGVPKLRGFKSQRPKNQVVNLVDINNNFKDGEIVNPKSLFELGLVGDVKKPIKILGKGELKVKDLKFENVLMSETVEKQLKK